MRRMYSPENYEDSVLMTCEAEVEKAVFTTTLRVQWWWGSPALKLEGTEEVVINILIPGLQAPFV
jgi:hypothetical protein